MSEIDADIMEKAHRAYFDPFEGEDHASGNAIIVSIARAIQAAKDDEREACAKVADEYARDWGSALGTPAKIIAAAIRGEPSEHLGTLLQIKEG